MELIKQAFSENGLVLEVKDQIFENELGVNYILGIENIMKGIVYIEQSIESEEIATDNKEFLTIFENINSYHKDLIDEFGKPNKTPKKNEKGENEYLVTKFVLKKELKFREMQQLGGLSFLDYMRDIHNNDLKQAEINKFFNRFDSIVEENEEVNLATKISIIERFRYIKMFYSILQFNISKLKKK